ncbi:DUF5689 domain-containing protein [Rufibacter roseus]|uniref:DUF5689 domain-containing protein n=1 Tax=Rufibacter roseus TaxID=1567108 RepID=A0ABW2DLU6_9BACT|nr:DUF5689 domain-containing protein [Rufibacter roseus]
MKNKIFTLLSLLLSALAFTSCLEEDVNNAIGTPSPYISLEDIRAMYKGNDVALSTDQLMGAQQILGVVISDPAGQNVPGGNNNIVVQSHRRGQIRGISLNLEGGNTSAFKVGDSVVVNLTGSTLTQRNGVLQITGLSTDRVVKVSENAKVHLREVSLEQLVTRPELYEGTLVKLVAGNVTPTPTASTTFSGDKTLTDGGANTAILHTEPTAAFANRRVYASASYTGIPVIKRDGANGPEAQLWVRNITDVQDPSGPIYPGFPESFEGIPQTTKPSYNMVNGDRGIWDNTVEFSTGPWKLYQAIIGNTAGRDRFTGEQGVRMQQQLDYDTYVEMLFDVPNGASKVTMLYGSYYNDASSTWRLEFSQDQGSTWTQIGPTISDASKVEKTAVFLMDVTGPVRFRVLKLGLGRNSATVDNGRLGLDDFAIYQN